MWFGNRRGLSTLMKTLFCTAREAKSRLLALNRADEGVSKGQKGGDNLDGVTGAAVQFSRATHPAQELVYQRLG